MALADLTDPEILLIPGGYGTRKLMKDEAMLAWVRDVHASSQWTTSVCTGALVLAAAGVLEGLEATTHWLSLDILREYGAEPVGRRVVEQGKVITAAGVSAGIDMALVLAVKARGRRRGAGHPAGDRIRPAAALRHGLPGEGAGGDPGARARCRAYGSRQLGPGDLGGRRAQAVFAGQPSRGFGSGVTDCSMRSRRCSKAGGSDRRSPRCSAARRWRSPGPSVAISNSTPLGSRK